MHYENEMMICFNGVLVLRDKKLKCQKLCNHMYNVMQYTGLKDKNGKEIYEGDIVQSIDDSHPIFKVVWLCDSEHACYALQQGKELWWLEHYPELEVKGNIYENPELLKTSGADDKK